MTGDELKQVFRNWGVTAAQGARVLCLHTNRLSEHLEDVSRIPCAVVSRVEALGLLPDAERQRLFERRIHRKADEGGGQGPDATGVESGASTRSHTTSFIASRRGRGDLRRRRDSAGLRPRLPGCPLPGE